MDKIMDEYQKKLEMLKLITSAENHFNNLCFNIRALSSTWLLATFGGIGWILKDLPETGGNLLINKIDLITGLCLCCSLGIFVLWILDLKIYQQLLHVWFEAREMYEDGEEFPHLRQKMQDLFSTGRASEYIKFYYMTTCSAPLLFNIYIMNATHSESTVLLLVLLVLVALNVVIYFLTPSKGKKEETSVN
jgi:hypothetical protein